MNKKLLLAACALAFLGMNISAAEPSTIGDRIDRVDEVIYGSAQTGSLLNRVNEADNMIYGAGNTSANGLDDRINNLYTDVVNNDDDAAPSISTRTNAMEYYLTDQISTDGLEARIGSLESTVYGAPKKGALDERLANMEKTVYGDEHYEMKSVELPKDTVFKIALNDDVNSKLNQVGDPVTFTVQEDVLVGDVLVLPRGAQGSGVVTKVTRPKSFGRSGALDISFDQVFSVDDEVIPTVLGPESKEKLKMEAAAVGASAIGALALGPVGLVGGFFVKGKDVDLPAGTELYIQTEEAVTTKGLVMKEGAPSVPLRKRIHRTIGADTEEKTQLSTAAADNEVTEVIAPTEEKLDTETPAGEDTAAAPEDSAAKKDAAPAKPAVSEQAKKELKEVRDKTTTAKGTADKAAGNSDEASVVIVRND